MDRFFEQALACFQRVLVSSPGCQSSIQPCSSLRHRDLPNGGDHYARYTEKSDIIIIISSRTPTDPSLVVHNSPQNLKLLIESKDPPFGLTFSCTYLVKSVKICKRPQKGDFGDFGPFLPGFLFVKVRKILSSSTFSGETFALHEY